MVWDAGLEYWPLVSRVLTFAVIGLVVALIYPTLVRASGAHAGRGAYGLAGLLGIGVVATLAYMFVPTHVVKADKVPAVQPVAPGTEQKDWAHWGNTTAGNRFAALDQINKGNIDQLQVAWTFRTGDLPESNGAGAEDQNTPLQIGDTVYTCTAYGKVFALDADTGAERWKCQRTWPVFTSMATMEEFHLSSNSVRWPPKKSGVALPVGRYTRPSLAS